MGSVLSQTPGATHTTPIGHRLREHAIRGSTPGGYVSAAEFYPVNAIEDAVAAERLRLERQYAPGRQLSDSGGAIISEAFPINSIFISAVATNPATMLGYGTWTQFGQGRVLVGIDPAQPEFDGLLETGGSKAHLLSVAEMPQHTHTQNAHNHTQDAHNHTQNSHNHTQDAHNHTQNSHNHGCNAIKGLLLGDTPFKAGDIDGALTILNTGSTTATNQPATATNQAATAVNQATTATNQATTATNQNAGGGAAHNNLQPYIVVYFWRRIG